MKMIYRIVAVVGVVSVGLAACAEGSDTDILGIAAGAGTLSGGDGGASAGGGGSDHGASVGPGGSTTENGSSTTGSGNGSTTNGSGGASSSSTSAGAGGAGGAIALCDSISCAIGCCSNDLCMAGTKQD